MSSPAKPKAERVPPAEETPPAGPHAQPELTDEAATPDAGALPDPEETSEIDPGTG